KDLSAVYQVASRLVKRARDGEGPSFLMCNTYRHTGHHVGDISREYYRSKQEEHHWKTERDPVKLFGEKLIAQKLTDAPSLVKLENKGRAERKAAVVFGVG